MRNFLIFLVLFLLVVIPFLIWGDWFAELFGSETAIEKLRTYGSLAWLAGILLLMADLFLPLPGTVIMSALGYLYGPFWGSLLAVVGGFLSGVLAYALCRSLGEKGALVLLGEKDFERGKRLFSKNGGWIVAISRWLPVFPEIVACMAGLNRMDWWKFVVALLCGAIPLGVVFAYIGHAGIDNPGLALGISAGLPVVLWLVAQYFLRVAARN